jgi:disease resistance protein RPM1
MLTEMERYNGASFTHAKPATQAFGFTREDDLVGVEENREKMIQWLTGDLEEQRSRISTVWGMPGVGKTTLVSHVYNAVKVEFDATAWITVSKSFSFENLLKKIAREFGIPVDIANVEMRSLGKAIHNYLRGKSYILILDDVWIADVWTEIRNLFPTDSIGRYVITSRNHEVSLLATGNGAIHLEPLQAHHSWLLFCREAFWNDTVKECPIELRNLAERFIKKCNGLPIAIACIGRLLSRKHPIPTEWGNVYMELELHSVKNVMPDVDMVLKVSLEDLPYDLKNCFLHCALFPEDYSIKRRRIMRHWIAAGLVKEKENKTLEEVAEGYLNELVNRSLLQVVERNYMGRLKCCRVHDVIRLLALNKAGEECFGRVYDGSRTFSGEHPRRISIHSENLDQLSRSGLTHLRAIHVFNRYINTDWLRPILISSNLLSTLDLQCARIEMLPVEVFNLFNLRYLGLRNTDIKSLPEEIRRLQNLEVLDAYNTKLSYLPNNMVKLQKLRYLFACTDGGGSEIKPFGGVKLPSGIHRLTSLHALQCVKANTEILREVGALTELRTFGVSDVKSEHSADLSNAITKMKHLIHLEITSIGEEEVLHLEGLCLPSTLSKLGLEGQLEKASMPQVVSSLSRLHNLTWLQLSFSKMDEESFSRLLGLRGLCFLQLLNTFEGENMHFSSGSFPKLRFLSVWTAPELNQVEIEEGALESLVELVFVDCPELMFLPHGIEHLRALEKLHLIETSEELIEKLLQEPEANECNEDLMNIRHIKETIVQLSREGIRERIRSSQDISAPR